MADGAPIKPKPRIAFSGEEFGFGYLATNKFASDAKIFGTVGDAGFSAGKKTTNLKEMQIRQALRDRFDVGPDNLSRLPMRSKEQALLAVKSGTADLAVVPFYSPYSGYDYETMRALANLFTLVAVEQTEATDQYCLAVYEPQVMDLVQSAHPGSGLSELLKHQRSRWGSHERASSLSGSDYVPPAGDGFRAGLKIDQSSQMMLRDRIDMIFCGPDAARRCKSKLDGLRSAGVDVAETLRSVEPHREMARLARKSLDRDRQVNTFFNPTNGEANYVSTMSSARQDSALYGVILPFQVAMMSPDFTIIDTDIEDSAPSKTRFWVVRQAPDETLYEDAFRTTDAKTRYWMERLRDVNDDSHRRYSQDDLNHDHTNGPGVRVMLRFSRAGDAASIGDLENYLRNHGVRHSVARLDEDSEKQSPAGIVLDMEFNCEDFDGDPRYRSGVWTQKWFGVAAITFLFAVAFSLWQGATGFSSPMGLLTSAPTWALLAALAGANMFWLSRFKRTAGSVVNGAMKTAFKQWKSRGVTVMAATPFETPQLPKHARRRWYKETPIAILLDAAETWQVRLSRLAPIILLVGMIVLGVFAVQQGYWPN